MEGSKLARRESKRSRQEETQMLFTTVDASSITEEAMQKFFEQYRNSCIRPPLAFLRNGFNQMYSNINQQVAALHMSLLSQQQHLASLEKQASRRMIILKLTDQPSLKDIKYNLNNLMCHPESQRK